MSRQTKNISDKNTKQDILIAYQELLDELNTEPLSQSTISQLEKYDKSVVTDLEQSIVQLKENLERAFDDAKHKFIESETMQRRLKDMHDLQKKTMNEEKLALVKQQEREKEEYNYEFAKMKKRQEEELSLLRQKTEMELAEKREHLKSQEEELVDLRNQAKMFEAKLQKAVNDAVSQTTKDLKLTFDHEKALMTQEAKLTQNLLEQRVNLFEQTIKQQQEEIARINTMANQATQQMTRIAERAVTKTPEAQVQGPNPVKS